MALHTFKLAFPEMAIEDDLGEALTAEDVAPFSHVVVEIDASKLEAVKTRAALAGWEYVGTGDQRPASVAAPTIPTYQGGITLLTGASATDLNNLAGHLQTVINALVARGILS